MPTPKNYSYRKSYKFIIKEFRIDLKFEIFNLKL